MMLIYSFVHKVLTNYRGKEFLDTSATTYL